MKKRHILLSSHNLQFEGAPIFLLNLARGLYKEFDFTVISPQDGPLREQFEELKINVQVLDYFNPKNLPEIKKLIQKLDIQLIVFNTILLHKFILDLKELDKKFVWIIHESEVALYFQNLCFQKSSFEACNKIVFVSAATSKLYERWKKHSAHFEVIHNGIDLQSIEQFKKSNPVHKIRKKYGHKNTDLIFADIGTLCARKGQKDLIEVFISLLIVEKIV